MVTEKDTLISLIKFLESNEDIKSRYQADIDSFKQQLEQAKLDRYRLGVIGVTSSGKSTMINAIMKQKLLTMAVQPSSSQLVTCSKSRQNQVKVYFEDKPAKVETGKSLSSILMEYGDERKNPENRLHVKQLEVSTPDFAFPPEILLIDSPGLDAYGLEGHEKLTMNSLLPTVDFCIFVTTCKTNSDNKMHSVLDTIADYECPLIIVQNMIDSLKPSPDGKKTVEMVADEHRFRIHRIVKNSRIKDKNNIHIIQISSKLALESFTAPLMMPKKREEYLKRSNFQGLVNAVNVIFNEMRPKIEYRRLTGVKKQVTKIISNARMDLQLDKNELIELKFEYYGYDKQITSTFDNAYSKLQEIIRNAENEKKYWELFFNSDDVTNGKDELNPAKLKKISEVSKTCQNNIVEIQKLFLENITDYCYEFHIDARRLRVMDSFGVAPQIHIHTKPHTRMVKKQGFGSSVVRFFGRLFDTNWGYEEVTEYVYDNEKTKQSVIRYFDSIISTYKNFCNKWESSAQTQVNLLLEQYQNRLEAFENRKKSQLDKRKVQEVINKLENLMAKIPDVAESSVQKTASVENLDFHWHMIQVKLDPCTYAMVKLADRTRISLHKNTIRAITYQQEPKNIIVVAWDSDCAARFVNNSFGYHEGNFGEGITSLHNITVLLMPTRKQLNTLLQPAKKKRCVFVLFNATQFGSGLNDVNRIGLVRFFSKNDSVYFVVQDFAELIVGEGIKEGIKNMLSIGEKLSLKKEYQILVNHSNPVYNLLIGELQRHPCVTHTDEIALLNSIQQRFPYLRSPKIDKYLSEIMAGFRKK